MFNYKDYYFKWLKTKGSEQYRCRFQSKINPEEFYICQVYPTKEGAEHSYKARVKTLVDGSWHVLKSYDNKFYSGMRDSIIYRIEHMQPDDSKQSNEIAQAQVPTFEDSDLDSILDFDLLFGGEE